MQVVRITAKGSFNSFRIPSGIRYHRTYHVPTKPTLIGLLGAAMGLEDVELPSLFNSVTTSAVLDSYSGTATDLWLITKLKTQGEPESSPIMREMLFEPCYSIYYSVSDSSDTSLDDIINAFTDPVFALSLGRSDEMIEVKEVTKVNLLSVSDGYFKNTILPFNYKDFFDSYENLPLRRGQTFSLPQVISIPIMFEITDRIRKPLQYLEATIVYDRAIKLRNKEGGLTDGQRKFFLY
ncbi:MAG: CRISPR-associated protein Cas5 [Candidatus Parvarchaeota archaeon]